MKLPLGHVAPLFALAAALSLAACSGDLSDTQTDQVSDIADGAVAGSERIADLEGTIEELETKVGELEDRLDNANIE